MVANRAAAVLLALCALLAGCGGLRIVDSDVQAFATTDAAALAPPLAFHFERLPSQQAQAAAQQALESLALPVLARAGLQPDTAQARFSLQLSLRSLRTSPWDEPYRLMPAPAAVLVQGGAVVTLPPPPFWRLHLDAQPPYYLRELTVVLRRLADGQVVYESRARHDGPWSDDEAVLPAMLEAALQGFPAPPAGTRRVRIEIPR